MNKVTRKLWEVFILLNVCDILTTEGALAMGAVEGNPLAAAIYNNFGEFGFWGLKALVITIYAFIYGYQVKTGNEKSVQIALVVGSVMMAAVTIWNAVVIGAALW